MKEQEVIKRLNFHKEYARLSSNRVVISETDLETVLNMLKEKDKEIEKKDKIIDLMAEHIHITGEYECPNINCEDNGSITCEGCIKQFFEQKATNNG